MRISSDSNSTSSGPFSELLHIQTDFYTRLADETLRYLRQLQGATVLAVPGTVLKPHATLKLEATGTPGSSAVLQFEVENRQHVHSVVTPLLSPLVDTSGVTWFPAAETTPPMLLLAPEDVAKLAIRLPLPASIPPGVYRGTLMLLGFREGAVAVIITVKSSRAKRRQAAKTTKAKKATPQSSKAARMKKS